MIAFVVCGCILTRKPRKAPKPQFDESTWRVYLVTMSLLRERTRPGLSALSC